ncbi:hypothetical protein JXA88_09365 [Candidatus Fermentibacteria bacterium]|nr:hypothetical protein [Candidatus Fermentibacteria bacterium]
MVRISLILTTTLLAMSATASPIETVVLSPGETADFDVETDGVADPHVAMAFDLTGLPKDAVVIHAFLRLTEGEGIPWDAEYVPVIVAPVTHSWNAESADAAWDEARTSRRVLMRQAATPAKFMLTTIVKEWLAGARPNHGLMAMLEEAADLADVAPHFNAETLKPTLEIRYLVPQADR